MTIGTLDQTALDQLRTGFAGDVILSDDPGYDAARSIFNAMIDKRPAVIAQCESALDVVAAVRVAREHSLEIAVRRASTASRARPSRTGPRHRLAAHEWRLGRPGILPATSASAGRDPRSDGMR